MANLRFFWTQAPIFLNSRSYILGLKARRIRVRKESAQDWSLSLSMKAGNRGWSWRHAEKLLELLSKGKLPRSFFIEEEVEFQRPSSGAVQGVERPLWRSRTSFTCAGVTGDASLDQDCRTNVSTSATFPSSRSASAGISPL